MTLLFDHRQRYHRRTSSTLLCLAVSSMILSMHDISHVDAWILSSPTTTRKQQRPSYHSQYSSRYSRCTNVYNMAKSEDNIPEEEEAGDNVFSPSSVQSSNNHHSNIVPNNITELAEKKVRLAKAQAEIDRILNCPVDPPFDAESELKKVVSISPADIQNKEEYAVEQRVSHLEEELYKSVKRTDFLQAAATSDELAQMHIDDCGLVLQVNSKFYQAFTRKDVDDMKQVWLPDRSCICIHPSNKPLVGIQAIQTSWDQMFKSSNGSFQRNWMEPHEIRLTVKANTAIVTCEERVFARRFIRGQKRQTELVNKLQATNIFRKVGGQWYMTYHHSSWHADSDAAKQALKGQRQQGRSKGAQRKSSSPSSPTSDIDNILGVDKFGPLLGDESKNENGGAGEKPVKRVIMGSLSDILNGNLGNIFDDDDDNDMDDNMDASSNNDEIKNGLSSNGIIRFQKINNDGDEDDSDDFDDDDDDDDDDDEDTLHQIREFAKKDDAKKELKAKEQEPRAVGNLSRKERQQGCIAALRKLANEGRISARQKRALLTDIISSSSRGEQSMVEVAYELLYCSDSATVSKDSSSDNSNDNMGQSQEDSEEEFADQCIVFAKSIEGF